MKGRKNIVDSINYILDELPGLVEQDCPKTAKFESEERQQVPADLIPLVEAKRALEQHSAKLRAYEENLSSLAQDHDLWLDREAILAKIANAVQVSKLPGSANLFVSIHLATTRQPFFVSQGVAASTVEVQARDGYLELLNALEGHCATILDSADSVRETVQQARQVQNTLYDVVNKVRALLWIHSSKDSTHLHPVSEILSAYRKIPLKMFAATDSKQSLLMV